MQDDKYLFIDRDGTLIREPAEDFQVDTLEKLELMPRVIPALLDLKKAGYLFVMITNQDGLGTEAFPRPDFDKCQRKMLDILESQGISFADILICPHLPEDKCNCRKPSLGLVEKYLVRTDWNREMSAVIGDRDTDMQLADKMGIPGLKLDNENPWETITDRLINPLRQARIKRKTKETDISLEVNLDSPGKNDINTGIGFFDHMLDQIATHGQFSLKVEARGDLDVDAHHTVEDIGLVLGSAMSKALGSRQGIERFGFCLPMDESMAFTLVDLSGRPYFKFEGRFPEHRILTFPSDMVAHFFRSFSTTLGASIHMKAEGENTHHMIEACFKCMGRALKQAVTRQIGQRIASTKGILT